MKNINFDRYLDQQLEDPAFAERFHKAGEAWDVALQITALRKRGHDVLPVKESLRSQPDAALSTFNCPRPTASLT